MRIENRPRVYLIGRTELIETGLNQFLSEMNLKWPTPTDGVKGNERIVETAGRCCYMSFGSKAGSKTNFNYIQNLLGRNADGTFRHGPAHGAVLEHPVWNFIIVGAGRGWCYDAQTEVLTDEGWKPWPQVRGNENFATLNIEKDLLEYQQATAHNIELYDGMMYRLKSKMVDMCVTPKHNMLYARAGSEKWRKGSAIALRGTRYRCKRNVGCWIGNTPEQFVINNQSGAMKFRSFEFAQFLGYWLADGHLEHSEDSGYFVCLSKNQSSKTFDRMTRLIEQFGLQWSIHGENQIRISGCKPLYEYLHPLQYAENKHVPREILEWGSAELLALLNNHAECDAGFTARGSGEAYTVSKQLADDLQEIALKCGFSATVREVDRRIESELSDHPIKSRQVRYVASYVKEHNEPLVNHNNQESDSWEYYKGAIYCVTVPNGTLYVRRNGRPVWSCNSHEQVRNRAGWAYSQLSTRYCDFEGKDDDRIDGDWEPGWCIPPLGQLSKETSAHFEKGFADSLKLYEDAVDMIMRDIQAIPGYQETMASMSARERERALRKAARGAARDLLMNATEAIMVMSCNARGLWNTIALRASRHAEAVIRDVYVQITRIMEVEMPSLFHGIKYQPVWDGIEEAILPRDHI